MGVNLAIFTRAVHRRAPLGRYIAGRHWGGTSQGAIWPDFEPGVFAGQDGDRCPHLEYDVSVLYSVPMEITAYSDGGCSGNPGPGGWAYVLLIDGVQKTSSGGDENTTNNRMELTAVINGLKDIYGHPVWRNARIVFNTDSQYVQRGITEWIKTWEKNGWRTKAKNPVKNQRLWRELKSLTDKLSVQWRWVRGHSGDPLNELCDRMVQAEIKRLSIGP